MGRRCVTVADQDRWVFNRVAEGYRARPPYPDELVDLVRAHTPPDGHVVDLGAGVGHLALPLARRGLRVTAVEPAARMLKELSTTARGEGLPLAPIWATAEATGLGVGTADMISVADALHFFDAELAGREVGRLLASGGRMVVLTASHSGTPFMRALSETLIAHTTRRPKPMASRTEQFLKVAGLSVLGEHRFEDVHDLDDRALLALLRSFSYVGPAMSPARFAALAADIHEAKEACGGAHYARELSVTVAG